MVETKFKDTEVGRIPEDWELVAINKLAEDMADGPFGSNLKTEHYTTDKQVRIIQLGNIGECGWLDDNTKYTTFEHAKTLTKCIVTPGCILVAKMMPSGRAIVCPSKEKQYILGSDVVKIVPNELLNANYFVYQSKSDIYLTQIATNTQGSTRQRTSISKLRDILIPLPPTKAEQIRLATALSNVDILISELDKLIEKKRAIKQGAMQQLLTGKIRLKGFSEPWVEKQLGEIGALAMCKRIFQEETSDSGEVPFYKIGTFGQDADAYISMAKYEQFKKMYRFPNEGDVLISAAGTIGRTVVYNGEPAYFQDSNIVWLAHNEKCILNSFLYYIYQRVEWNTENTTIARLYNNNFNNTIVRFPKSFEEQKAIVSVLSSMNKEIVSLESKREKYIAIKHGMMQQLLTGKIRLMETVVKTKATIANVHFRRSVLAAEIADRLCDEPTFGHVKMEKILFLTERLCHIDIGSHYHRDAAGPYDNNALRSIDSQLKKQKWFVVQRTEKGNRYVPMQDRGKHKTYFDRYYSDVLPTFEKIINTFKTQRTEQCEIVATLYSAWEDLLHSNKPFTDADIVNEVLNNWHESKKRISQDRWLKAIQWMRENGFTPDNNNNLS